MKFYVVAGWYRHYVKAQAAQYDRLPWVAQSTNLLHDSYLEIVQERRGIAVYGVFRVLVSLAATCDPPGVLVQRNGDPFDASSISKKTSIPRAEIERALPVLIKTNVIHVLNDIQNAIRVVNESRKATGEFRSKRELRKITQCPTQSRNPLKGNALDLSGSECGQPFDADLPHRPPHRQAMSAPMSAPMRDVTERNVTIRPTDRTQIFSPDSVPVAGRSVGLFFSWLQSAGVQVAADLAEQLDRAQVKPEAVNELIRCQQQLAIPAGWIVVQAKRLISGLAVDWPIEWSLHRAGAERIQQATNEANSRAYGATARAGD